MRYVDESRQELLISSPQFPALVLAHASWDKAPFHWHAGLELIYAKDCPVMVSLRERTLRLDPGNVFVVPPETMHAIRMMEGDPASTAPHALSVTLNPADMTSVFPNIMQAQRALDYQRCNQQGSRVLAGDCEDLYSLLVEDSPVRYLKANSRFYSLIAKLFGSFVSPDDLRGDSSTRDERTIALVHRYVQTRFMDPLTTTEVARHFGYSREYFSRFFKKYAGVSFREYVNELRLDAACEQLRDADVPIGQVGRMSGFASEKSFRQVFFRKFGCTPDQYRCNERKYADQGWSAEDWPAADLPAEE